LVNYLALKVIKERTDMKLNKIKMTIKKTEFITVEVSEGRGYEMPTGLSETFNFIEGVKADFIEQIEDVDLAEAGVEYELTSFEIEEEK